jgi:hypothetical protein
MFATNTSSRLWITHFTPVGSPAEVAVGDTFKATLVFTPNNVATAPGTGRGLRIGLFNFSEPDANRVSGDGFSTGAGGGAPGTNVTGYILNMNFAQIFTIANPLQIMKRTDTANINLMGASAVFTGLSSGGGSVDTPGFRNGVQYQLEFSVKRGESSVDITTRFSDGSGWSISHTATDSTSPGFRFDTFAIRPNSVADTAETFTFTRFKTEVIPYELRITSVRFLMPEGLTITWDTLPGKTYQVEGRLALDAGSSWEMLGTVSAAGNTASFSDVISFFEPQRFYRVLQLP